MFECTSTAFQTPDPSRYCLPLLLQLVSQIMLIHPNLAKLRVAEVSHHACPPRSALPYVQQHQMTAAHAPWIP